MSGYMSETASKAVSELPTCDWEAAIAQCGTEDDYEDTLFLMELLICFYVDSIPRLIRILEITRAWQQNNRHDPFIPTSEQAKTGFDSRPKYLETVLREDAHAIKGSAANISLWRISKSAENIELPIKLALGLEGATDPNLRNEVLGKLLDAPSVPIVTLINEFRNLCSFIIGEATSRADAISPDLIPDLPEESLTHYEEKCNLTLFEKEIVTPFAYILLPAKQTAGEQQKEDNLTAQRYTDQEKMPSVQSSASEKKPTTTTSQGKSMKQVDTSARVSPHPDDMPAAHTREEGSRMSGSRDDNKLSNSGHNVVFQIGTMSPNFEHPSTLYRDSSTTAPALDKIKAPESSPTSDDKASVSESSPDEQSNEAVTGDQESPCCILM